MTTRDEGQSAGPRDAAGREQAATGAREQGTPDTPRSAAEAAEREQARQLEEGTETPG